MSHTSSILPLLAASMFVCPGNVRQALPGCEVAPIQVEEKTGATDQAGRLVEGKDYVVLERVRFLDEMGFERPVEAFSMLFPKGWKTEGGVRWKGVQECRGEMVSNHAKGTSPDGKIQFEALPARAFGWTDDQLMLQTLMLGAESGGCQVNQPFTAEQYIAGYAQQDLGAKAMDIRLDEARMPLVRQLDEQANAIAKQYGNDMEQSSSIATGRLVLPDGTQGIMEAGVSNSIMRRQDMFSGKMTSFSSTQVFHCTVMRFSPELKEEAAKLLAVFSTSFRTNPAWQQAKDAFLTQLGNVEHAGRMERIRLTGEQAGAYAKVQGEASEQRMRSWKQQQASEDREHTRFTQTMREVETWKDGSNGSVELSSGYDHAWSRSDGSYILTNNPNFDPSSVFLDQEWKPMKRAE